LLAIAFSAARDCYERGDSSHSLAKLLLLALRQVSFSKLFLLVGHAQVACLSPTIFTDSDPPDQQHQTRLVIRRVLVQNVDASSGSRTLQDMPVKWELNNIRGQVIIVFLEIITR
jgi:hypothetical protein